MVRAHTIGAALLVLGSLAGCPSEAPSVDAGGDDGGVDLDGGVDSSALRFQFVSRPQIPGAVSGDYPATLVTVDIDLENIRAIGDAAPGDERTTAAAFAIAFAEHLPGSFLLFADAPPGIYSHLLAQVVGYRITGTVVLEATPIPFTIDDTPPAALSLSIPLSDVRVDDQRTDVVIELDLEGVIHEIEWELFDSSTSEIEIDESWSAIGELREHLVEAFLNEAEESAADDAED